MGCCKGVHDAPTTGRIGNVQLPFNGAGQSIASGPVSTFASPLVRLNGPVTLLCVQAATVHSPVLAHVPWFVAAHWSIAGGNAGLQPHRPPLGTVLKGQTFVEQLFGAGDVPPESPVPASHRLLPPAKMSIGWPGSIVPGSTARTPSWGRPPL